jgi:hypothetical protein
VRGGRKQSVVSGLKEESERRIHHRDHRVAAEYTERLSEMILRCAAILRPGAAHRTHKPCSEEKLRAGRLKPAVA